MDYNKPTIILSPNIKNVKELPKELNFNINDFINIINENNKKYLIVSFLNEIILFKHNTTINYVTINNLIFYLIKIYNPYFNIYPCDINIIHFILFNNLDINILLKIILLLHYNKNLKINSNYENYLINIKIHYNNINDIFSNNQELNKLIKELYNSLNLYIINTNFNNNYIELFLYNKEYKINETFYDKIKNISEQINENIIDRIYDLEIYCNRLDNLIDNNDNYIFNKILNIKYNIKNINKNINKNFKFLNYKIYNLKKNNKNNKKKIYNNNNKLNNNILVILLEILLVFNFFFIFFIIKKNEF
jgi:hypothetical protein